MADFRDEANEIRGLAHFVHLRILVWGPGDPGPRAKVKGKRAYQKRLQIKKELKKNFRRSEVYFSEDKEMIRVFKGVRGQLRKEALQAKVSDTVIMLDLGRGVDVEIDHFLPTYDWFPPKVHLLVPKKYVDTKGLVKEVYEYLRNDQIYGFTPRQFETCSVASKMAVEATLGVAYDKMLEGKRS